MRNFSVFQLLSLVILFAGCNGHRPGDLQGLSAVDASSLLTGSGCYYSHTGYSEVYDTGDVVIFNHPYAAGRAQCDGFVTFDLVENPSKAVLHIEATSEKDVGTGTLVVSLVSYDRLSGGYECNPGISCPDSSESTSPTIDVLDTTEVDFFWGINVVIDIDVTDWVKSNSNIQLQLQLQGSSEPLEIQNATATLYID